MSAQERRLQHLMIDSGTDPREAEKQLRSFFYSDEEHIGSPPGKGDETMEGGKPKK